MAVGGAGRADLNGAATVRAGATLGTPQTPDGERNEDGDGPRPATAASVTSEGMARQLLQRHGLGLDH